MRSNLLLAVVTIIAVGSSSACALSTDSHHDGKSTGSSTENVGESASADNVAGCGQTAWSLKVGTDANRGSISGTAQSWTVSQIAGLSNPFVSNPASTGYSEVNNDSSTQRTGYEYTLVDVKAYLDIIKYENSSTGDSDYHLGIVDPANTAVTMIAEMPWSGSQSGCGQYGCNASSYNNSGTGASYGCVGEFFDLGAGPYSQGSIVWNNGRYTTGQFAANRSWFDNMPYAPWVGSTKLISGYIHELGAPCQCTQTTTGTYNSCTYGSYTCHSDTDWLTIHLQGVIFFDAAHGQTDVASNAAEIHPVTKFCIAAQNGDCTPGNTLQTSGNW